MNHVVKTKAAAHKKILNKFKNSLEFEFTVKVKLDNKNSMLKNIENDSLEDVIIDLIDYALSDYCEKCGDAITDCGDAEEDNQWVGATYPKIEIIAK